jgi:hypothetical protein
MAGPILKELLLIPDSARRFSATDTETAVQPDARSQVELSTIRLLFNSQPVTLASISLQIFAADGFGYLIHPITPRRALPLASINRSI